MVRFNSLNHSYNEHIMYVKTTWSLNKVQPCFMLNTWNLFMIISIPTYTFIEKNIFNTKYLMLLVLKTPTRILREIMLSIIPNNPKL